MSSDRPLRVLHFADFRPRDNADEQAVAHALRKLGHEVLEVPDNQRRLTVADVLRFGPDFLLSHKPPPDTLHGLPCKKVVWFWDMIRSNDWELQARSDSRAQWATDMAQVADLMFLTDGDWVAKDTTGKLHHLMQGADERVTGPWGSHPGENRPPAPPESWAPNWTGDILFTGSVIHGGVRASFVDEMQRVWGNRFLSFGHHAKDRVHGRRLAELMACAKVVVCPDGPVTNRYASNRLVQALGFGAFVMHPEVKVATDMYPNGGVALYERRDELHDAIAFWLELEEERRGVAGQGFKETMFHNLYRHRCAQLVDVVRDKLGVK
jgi:hypothetical protein